MVAGKITWDGAQYTQRIRRKRKIKIYLTNANNLLMIPVYRSLNP